MSAIVPFLLFKYASLGAIFSTTQRLDFNLNIPHFSGMNPNAQSTSEASSNVLPNINIFVLSLVERKRFSN